HRCKTGALLRASCRMGAIVGLCAKAPSEGVGRALADPSLASLTAFGTAGGLMYQIVDDLLDVEQTTESAGKRTGTDADAGKLTFPGVLGVDGSRREVERLRQEAHAALGPLGTAGGELAAIGDYLAVRTS